jgi:hypothetical protein
LKITRYNQRSDFTMSVIELVEAVAREMPNRR